MNPDSSEPQTKRLAFVVAYDGAGFRGLAPNLDVRTVVGELQPFLSTIVRAPVDLVMSGRTDAGVHAWGQVLSVDVPIEADPARIQRSVNSKYGPEVVVRSIHAVDADFSARYSAIGRRYRYTILNRAVPDPFLARTAWWVADELDLDAMISAAEVVLGEHDFSSFCRRPKTGPEVSLVRKVRNVRWHRLDPGDVLRFDIEGRAFCHQMVRSIVGNLVAIGEGRRTYDDLVAILAARDRAEAYRPAPPHGLCLWQVDYPIDLGPSITSVARA